MELFDDELGKIFDSVDLLPHIDVEKIITDEGEEYIPIRDGSIEDRILRVVRIVDKRSKKPLKYEPKLGDLFKESAYSEPAVLKYKYTTGMSIAGKTMSGHMEGSTYVVDKFDVDHISIGSTFVDDLATATNSDREWGMFITGTVGSGFAIEYEPFNASYTDRWS